ncbi:MAG TPA: protease modulator HflK, partial [Gammaproteobacteria bacterium]|nr:protease modulator HflK [Gammaproteobacteria bacterium]
MLTRDENIVELRMEVQYKINDAAYYLFNVKNPDLTLRQLTESA